MQMDPLGYVDGQSLYGYARANPVDWIDSLGLRKGCRQPKGCKNWRKKCNRDFERDKNKCASDWCDCMEEGIVDLGLSGDETREVCDGNEKACMAAARMNKAGCRLFWSSYCK